MKRISHTSRAKDKTLHIETDLGIVNIRVGLTDFDGCPVESIEIIPDNYAEETPVVLDGYAHNRLIRGGEEKQAAASELLETLKTCLVMAELQEKRHGYSIENAKIAENIRAAIEKAEGNG